MLSTGFGIQAACRVLEAEEHELFSLALTFFECCESGLTTLPLPLILHHGCVEQTHFNQTLLWNFVRGFLASPYNPHGGCANKSDTCFPHVGLLCLQESKLQQSCQ